MGCLVFSIAFFLCTLQFLAMHSRMGARARTNQLPKIQFSSSAVWQKYTQQHTMRSLFLSLPVCLPLRCYICALLAIFVALTFVFMLMNNAQRICTIIITLLLSSLVRSLMTQQNELWLREEWKREAHNNNGMKALQRNASMRLTKLAAYTLNNAIACNNSNSN